MAPRKGTRRACDPCSVRKIRCDGSQPCSRCTAASWDCTYLKTHGKSGPKGPRRTTEAAIRRLQDRSRTNSSTARSDSETSFDDASPTTMDLPPLEHLPPIESIEVDGLGWPDIVASPNLSGTQQGGQRISTSCLSHYLDLYQLKGYPIWPVVDTEALIARLLTQPNDMEAYSVAVAICAAIVGQFQVEAEPESPVEGHFRVSSATFAEEAKRSRELSDHLENVTIWSLLSSFFLHVYSADVGRMTASTVFLGEAITKAHILGLHTAVHYEQLGIEIQQHHLRIYELLFVTERAHSIQHDVPTMLKRATNLPLLVDLKDGSVQPAFIQLCRLFHILDVTITADPSSARSALALAQQQLGDDTASHELQNELQRADIAMTQQWMRIFLWQHALSVTNMGSSSPNDEFSFSFPTKVAQNVLTHVGSLSKESLEAHGPGMETKLLDIATSLADVMIYVPTLNQESRFSIGPRDLIHSLSTLLASFRGGNPAVIGLLQEKMANLGVTVTSPKRLLDLSSSEDEQDEYFGNKRPRSITWSDSALYTPTSPAQDFFIMMSASS